MSRSRPVAPWVDAGPAPSTRAELGRALARRVAALVRRAAQVTRPRRLRVTAAGPAEGGRVLPLTPLTGPRPPLLSFGAACADIDALLFPDFSARFAAPETRLYTVAEGYLLTGFGYDGAVVGPGRRLVCETAAFTPFATRPGGFAPYVLPTPIHKVPVVDVVAGFEGAFRNYFHWLVHGLWRTWVTAQGAPGAQVALPDFDAEVQPGQVSPAVLRSSFAAAFPGVTPRALGPGAHPVRNLSFVWTRPTTPTDLIDNAEFAPFFERIRRDVLGPRQARRRRIFFSRNGATDHRLPPGCGTDLGEVLHRHGVETIAADRLSFSEQVEVAAGAEVLVGAHGAALTNLLFSPRDALVVELQRRIGDEPKFRPWFYQLTSVRGQPYAALDTGHPDWLRDLDTALGRL